jgi:hypothetical protein
VQSSPFLNSGLIHDADSDYGWSIGRGKWTFQRNAWTTLKQTIRLNSFTGSKPNPDGQIIISANGAQKIVIRNVVLRNNPKIKAIGIQFDTFFGGNSPDYETPVEQRVFFRGFSLSAF